MSLLLSKVLEINGVIKNIIDIKKILIIIDVGIIENNTFLLLVLLSATILLIAKGKPNEANEIIKEYVGIIKLYKLISFWDTVLVNIILIINPNNLVSSEPIININVDLTNLFFIIKYMILKLF